MALMMATMMTLGTGTNPMDKPFVLAVIQSTEQVDEETGEPLYWCNSCGWVDRDSATEFNYLETTILDLPIGGRWVSG
jgi:hypothetical protein